MKLFKASISRRKRRELIQIAIITVFAVLFAVVILTPIILTITNSFMSQTEINANYGAIFAKTEKGGKIFISEKVNLKFIPDMISFSQYITVLLKSPAYLIKFWNSVILVLHILVFQLAVAVFASYGFMRAKGKLKEIIFFTYIILMLMPYQVTLVPNYLVSNWFHLIDTRWSIWLPGIASPFAVYLLTKFMRRIPSSFIEAAQIDGAGEWQIFSKICFPLCKSCLYSVAILVFIDYWNMVEQPLILLSDTEMHPLSVFLSQVNTNETGLAFALATIYMIPGLLVFLYGEDYLVEGIMYQGGVKG
ncbi:MAG: carbohydrate ABC transporter permease [Lachnospiraceae bacterium]|nr:carbohydrate ABC transporter permease [Lachnospiraceae bacterium]